MHFINKGRGSLIQKRSKQFIINFIKRTEIIIQI